MLGKRVGYFLQLYIKETCILNFARSNCGGIYVYSVVQNQDLCKWRTWTRSMPFLRSIFHTFCRKFLVSYLCFATEETRRKRKQKKIPQTTRFSLFSFTDSLNFFISIQTMEWHTLRFRSISLKLKWRYCSPRITRLLQFVG